MMLLLTLSLIQLQPPAPQDLQAELKKITAAIQTAHDSYAQQARQVNGTVSTYDLVDGNKKLTHKTVVKADKTRYLTVDYNGDKIAGAEVFRQFGDMRQVLLLHFDHSKGLVFPRIKKEVYSKKGEKHVNFEIEDNRVFAYESPSTFALLPVPQMKLCFLDYLDYPAFKVTSIENLTAGSDKIVKVSFVVDQDINAKQSEDKQLLRLKKGWFEFRPDQSWTLHRSEYTLQPDARKPARTWKADYIYDAAKTAIPLLKEIKLATLDPKDKTEMKPINRSYAFDFKIVEGSLPDDQFALKQFDLHEWTYADYLKEEENRKTREAKANDPGPDQRSGFLREKPGMEVPLWAWIAGVLVTLVIIMSLIYQKTTKNVTA